MLLNRLLLVGILVMTLVIVLMPGHAVVMRGLVAGTTAALLVAFWEWAHAVPERIVQRRVVFILAFVTLAVYYREAMALIWAWTR